MPHVCKCGICGATMGWVGLPAVDPTPFSNESALRESGFSAETKMKCAQCVYDVRNPDWCEICGTQSSADECGMCHGTGVTTLITIRPNGNTHQQVPCDCASKADEGTGVVGHTGPYTYTLATACNHPLETMNYHGAVTSIANDFRCTLCSLVMPLTDDEVSRWYALRSQPKGPAT